MCRGMCFWTVLVWLMSELHSLKWLLSAQASCPSLCGQSTSPSSARISLLVSIKLRLAVTFIPHPPCLSALPISDGYRPFVLDSPTFGKVVYFSPCTAPAQEKMHLILWSPLKHAQPCIFVLWRHFDPKFLHFQDVEHTGIFFDLAQKPCPALRIVGKHFPALAGIN